MWVLTLRLPSQRLQNTELSPKRHCQPDDVVSASTVFHHLAPTSGTVNSTRISPTAHDTVLLSQKQEPRLHPRGQWKASSSPDLAHLVESSQSWHGNAHPWLPSPLAPPAGAGFSPAPAGSRGGGLCRSGEGFVGLDCGIRNVSVLDFSSCSRTAAGTQS